uniref:Opsin n=1 Tax=Dugesia japonica TaxID=6161 RepID=A0A0F7CAN1_DUGJA|nr:opsin [Dugesia japonica]
MAIHSLVGIGQKILENATSDNASLSKSPWHWDPEFESIVHPYWRTFDMVPEVYHYLVGVFISIVGISGVLGNLLVLYIFASAKSLRTPPNMFIMSLAIGDLTFSAVNGFPLLTISSFNHRWAWGKLTCEIYGFIGGLFGFISINTMALISLDRYFVIAQPFQTMKSLTIKRAIIMLVFVWLYSLIWSTPPFFGYGNYVPEGFQTSCTFDYLTQSKGNVIFNIGMYIGNFVIPVGIIIFCYYQIVKAVRVHELEMLKMAQKMNASHPTSMKTGAKKADVQAAKISIIIVFLYLLSWTPYAIIALMALTGRRDHLNPYTAELPVLFAKTSAMYNPFIYAINHPKFRESNWKRNSHA